MDIDTSSRDSGKKVGVRKGKKLSTRVDLTPMVDLGFLLITFFMFTTTMSQPNSMHLNMPDDNAKDTSSTQKVKQSGAMTIWLGKNNNIYFYKGLLSADLSNVQRADYKSIGDTILSFKRDVIQEKGNDSDLFMIVMPGNQSTYKNIIDILDEFSINVVDRYALVNQVDPQYEKDIELFDSKADSASNAQ